MTETIIRWAINVVLLVLAFIWGYREGQVKGYTYYIEQSKKIEDGLLSIINDMYDRLNKYRDSEGRAE